MRHRCTKRILNRPRSHRLALVRNLMTSLFLTGSLQTTDAKAKALTSEAEKLITLVRSKLEKKEEMNAIRELKKVLFTEESQKAALSFAKGLKIPSGFTRETKIGFRDGDGGLVVQVDLIADKK